MLAPHLGERDLQVGGWKDSLLAGGRTNQKFKRDLAHPVVFAHIAYAAMRGKSPFDAEILQESHKFKYRKALGPSPEHAEASKVRAFVGEDWDCYFKFCFVRNPYAKAVSDWKHRMRVKKKDVSFAEFLRMMIGEIQDIGLLPHMRDNWPIYTIDDRIVADYVGRFENLDQDLKAVFERLSLPFSGRLAETNRARPYAYRDYYDVETRKMTARLFEKEIETFRYQF